MNKIKVLTILALLVSNVMYSQAPQLNFLGVLEYGNTDLSDIWGYAKCGQEYALLGLESGFSIVDVTDPTNPTELHFIPGVNDIWRDVKTWNDYAYVVNEGGGGLLIVDLSGLPGSIQTYNWSSGGGVNFSTAHNIFIDENGIGYICGANFDGGGVIYLDLNADPINPPVLGRYSAEYVHDLFVRGDTMWVCEVYRGRVRVVDVTDKANETLMGQISTPADAAHNVWLSDDNQFMFTTDETFGGQIAAYDVSDPSDMFLVDTYNSSGSSGAIPHNAFVKGDYLVNSYYTDGVTVVDISNPYNMTEVDIYDTDPGNSGYGFSGCWGVYPYLPSGNIIASDQYEGLFVFGDPNGTPGGGGGSAANVNVDLKVMLEGAYTGGNTMSTNLTDVLPLQHPYSAAPYNYTGTESLTSIPANMVDWVLVEARSGNPSTTGVRTTSTEETKVGILLSNGKIVSTDGASPLLFTTLTAGSDYYFCVRHRNHMDILTADPICLSSNVSFDFTGTTSKAFGSNQLKSSSDGKALMFAGDYDNDGDIQNLDFDLWSFRPAVLNTYDDADGNLDGIIQVTDFDSWYFNRSKISIVEVEF